MWLALDLRVSVVGRERRASAVTDGGTGVSVGASRRRLGHVSIPGFPRVMMAEHEAMNRRAGHGLFEVDGDHVLVRSSRDRFNVLLIDPTELICTFMPEAAEPPLRALALSWPPLLLPFTSLHFTPLHFTPLHFTSPHPSTANVNGGIASASGVAPAPSTASPRPPAPAVQLQTTPGRRTRPA